MATIAAPYDESLAERDEVYFSNTHIIDTEPFYENFTNILRHSNERKSQIIDGYIFNLIQIVEDIGYKPKYSFIHSSQNNKNNGLLNIILQLGGAYGPLVNKRRLNIDKQYFQRWYLEKYSRSASIIRYSLLSKKTTQISDDYQSDINRRHCVIINSLSKQMDEKHFEDKVLRMYGFDDVDTVSSISSSRRSSIDEKQTSTPIILETINNSKPKQQKITIREYYPTKNIPSLMVNRSLSSSSSSSQQTINDNEYEQFIYDHPDSYYDINPEIITKPNPDPITYKQNISVRYLIPPTPPPPGPLIIREIVPPHPPTPPPLIIKHQDPSSPTPPPLILREAPPLPPPHQEPKIINKILPQEPPSSQQVIMKHNAALPPKPQSIIIEKWLPYKPPPPREIIYERIIETPLISEFQPGGIPSQRQRHHSADFNSKSSSRLPIPVHIERQNSFDHLETKQLSLFDQFAWSTQQHLEAILAHQQWIANQHQQHMNMFGQIPLQLTTPALIVNHPPVTRTATSYVQREKVLYNPTFMYPTYT